MKRRDLLLTVATALGNVPAWALPDSDVLVIAHPGVQRIDPLTVMRLYTGRAIEAGNRAVTVVNLVAGHPVRERFLQTYLQTDEERYRAYWTVRRHVGRGAPPPELPSVAALLEHVTRTPGAVGYADAGSLPASANVICRA